MSRYIDADKAKEKLGIVRGAYSCFLEEDRPYYDVLSETIKMINEMPTADVRENVRGEWVYHTEPLPGLPYGHYTCSLCDEIVWNEFNFCPNCGADMRSKSC